MSKAFIEKIHIFGAQEEKQRCLELLQEAGIIEKISENSTNLPLKGAEIPSEKLLKKLEKLLEHFEKENKESLSEKYAKRYISKDALFMDIKEYEDTWNIIDRLDRIWSHLNQNEESIRNLEKTLLEYQAWKQLDLSLKDFVQKSRFFDIAFLSCHKDNFKTLQENLGEKLCTIFVSSDESQVYFVSVSPKGDNLQPTFDTYHIEEVNLPQLNVDMKNKYANWEKDLEEKKILQASLEQEFAQGSQYLAKFRFMYDYMHNLVDRDLVEKNISSSSYLFWFTTFIPKKDLPLLEEILEKNFEYTWYETVPLEENEEVPVLLDNSPLVKPFEFVTEMYGTPGKGDFDPTPFLAPFYAIFVGFALADAGYGLFLTLVTSHVLRKWNLADGVVRLIRVLYYGSLASIFVGLISGSYFGIDFYKLGIDVPALYNPIRDLNTALGLSLGLGFFHIWTGYALNVWFLFKEKRRGELWMDAIPLFLILTGLGVWIVSLLTGMPVVGKVSLPVVYVGILMVLLFSGRHSSDSIVGKFFWGVYGVYNLTGIFGDILSYARLFALGLSGGVIASVINELSYKMVANISFEGWGWLSSSLSILAFVVVLIFGHLFSLSLSILGAMIHSMRLQFVEFFGKFGYEGGGRNFTPFKLRLKYFLISKGHHAEIGGN